MISLIDSHPGNEDANEDGNQEGRKLVLPLPDDLCKSRESFPASTPRDFQNARGTPLVVIKQTYKKVLWIKGNIKFMISPCFLYTDLYKISVPDFNTGALISRKSSHEFYFNTLIDKNAILLYFFQIKVYWTGSPFCLDNGKLTFNHFNGGLLLGVTQVSLWHVLWHSVLLSVRHVLVSNLQDTCPQHPAANLPHYSTTYCPIQRQSTWEWPLPPTRLTFPAERALLQTLHSLLNEKKVSHFLPATSILLPLEPMLNSPFWVWGMIC